MFEAGNIKGTPNKMKLMSLVYKCSNCPGNIYSIKPPSKINEPVKCNNCGTMNTRYKIKEGYFTLFWYNTKLYVKKVQVYLRQMFKGIS